MPLKYNDIPFPVIVLQETRISAFNEAAKILLGLNENKDKDNDFVNYLLTDIKSSFTTFIGHIKKSDKNQTFGPVEIKNPKKKNRSYILNGSPLSNEQILILLTPIPETLQKSRHTLSNYTSDPEIILQNEKIVAANNAAIKLIGAENEKELTNENITEFTNKGKGDKLSETLLRKKLEVAVQKTNNNVFYEIITDKSGNEIPVNIFVRKVNFNNKDAYYLHLQDLRGQFSNEEKLLAEKMQYRKLLNSLPNGIIIHHKGKILFINKKGVEFTGYSTHLELVGKEVIKLFREEKKDIKGFSTQNFICGTLNNIAKCKLKIQRIDGNLLPIEAEISKIFYEGKESILLVLKDIREKELALERLKETEQRLQLLINTLPDIICFKDGKGRWLLANKADLKLFDLENVDYFGKTDAELAQYTPFHRDAFLTCAKTDEIAWQKGTTTHTDEVIPTKNEGTKIFDVYKIPLYNTDGSKKGLVVIGRDVTERRKHEKELQEQRIRAQNYLNIAQVIMISLDKQANITMINNKGVEILGYKNYNELLNKNWFEISCNNPDEIKRRKTEYRQIMDGKTPSEYYTEGFIRDYKAQKRIIGWHSTVIKDNNGNITGILSSGVDITETVETTGKLREKSEQLELIINKTPALLAYADKDVRYLYVNNAYAEFYHATPEEMEGKKASDFIPDEYYQNIRPYIERVLNGEEVVYENKRHNRYGKTIYIKASYVPHFDENGNVDSFLAMIEDITETKLREIELEKALQVAEMNDKLKRAFLNNLSHEFRTPMNAIIGFGELLKDDPSLSEEGKEQVEIITSSTIHLLELITNIIDLSRIEAGELYLQTEVVHVNKMLYDIYNEYKKEAEMRGLYFHIEAGVPDENAILISDEGRIKQIINNLISNAFKFTNRGGVSLGYSMENNEFIFFVKDTGIGIPGDQQEAVFEHFRQVELEHTRHFGGTGVGLTISKLIVEKLGGKIWVHSYPGKGSSFYFSIPKEKTTSFVKPESIKPKQKRKSLSNKNLFRDFKGKTFLVTEDDKDVQTYFRALFKNTGVNLLMAGTGKHCLNLYNDNKDKIALILMDIRLGDIHGIELTKIIKKDNKYIPILIQTAFEKNEEKESALKAGADDYITKPINKNELYEKIKNLLG